MPSSTLPGSDRIEMRREQNSQTQLYRIGRMNFVARERACNHEMEPLDVAYAEVPSDLVPRFQASNEQGRIILDYSRVVLLTKLDCLPTKNREYGFAGVRVPTSLPLLLIDLPRFAGFFQTTIYPIFSGM